MVCEDLFVLICYTLCTLLRSSNKGECCGTPLWNIMWYHVDFTQGEYQGHGTRKKWSSNMFSVTVLWSAVQLGSLLLDLCPWFSFFHWLMSLKTSYPSELQTFDPSRTLHSTLAQLQASGLIFCPKKVQTWLFRIKEINGM